MKLLASDYDDTLYIDEKISKEDLMAIQKFQAQGHMFGINSGRHLDSLFEECEKFGLTPDFYIGNNGTVVLNKEREVVFIAEFETEVINEVLNYFRTNLRDKVYFISVNNGYSFGREFFNEGCEFYPDHLEPLDTLLEGSISTMFSQAIDPKDTMPLVNQLREVFNDRVYFYGNSPFIDIVSDELDKATGIEVVADLYQIKHDDCYAIGDSYNDMSMLSSYHGFVMSHARNSVKEVANEVVNSVSEAIDKILINNVK